jgi:amino acid permease
MAAGEPDEASPLLGVEQSSDMSDAAESVSKQIRSIAEPQADWDPETQQGPSRLDESDFVTATEDRDLRRGLHQRHVSLIAIAGAIVRSLLLLIHGAG